MPTNLRFLEKKFKALEEREKKLKDKSKSTTATRYKIARGTDPEVEAPQRRDDDGGEDSMTVAGGNELQREALLHTERAMMMQDSGTTAAKAVTKGVSSRLITAKQRATEFFEKQQKNRLENLSHEDDETTFLTSIQQSNEETSGDAVHLRPLFGQRGYDEGAEDNQEAVSPSHYQQRSKGAADVSFDDGEVEGQVKTIERMTFSDSQAARSQLQGTQREAAPPSTVVPATLNHRPYSATSSLFANANPIRLKASRPLSAAAGSNGPSRPATAQGAHESKLNVGDGRATSASSAGHRSLLSALPPVIPVTGVARGAKRFTSREHASQSTGVADAEATPLPRSTMHSSSVVEVPSFALLPDYYFLQIKIVHAAPSLAHWEFLVVVSDVTNPTVTPKHQFKGLKVNPSRYLIFQPPDGVTLNPLRQIPWATSPAMLYLHTLRVEVFAVSPATVKVVDTMVHYGAQ